MLLEVRVLRLDSRCWEDGYAWILLVNVVKGASPCTGAGGREGL